MAGETIISVVGNLVEDPVLNFTPGGDAVVNFTVASTPRYLDKQSGEWRDGEALFLRASLWRQGAENTAESLRKGDRVIVVGRLKQRSFEDRDGNKRTVIEMDADDIGPSLKFATAAPQKSSGGAPAPRQPSRERRETPQRERREPARSAPAGRRSGPSDDPWADVPGGYGSGSYGDDEPPF